MLKTIILVRHGKTEKNKDNPDRKLTAKGRMLVAKTALELLSFIKSRDGIIITTQTKRARQSARILAKTLNLKVKETQINLRVSNFDIIEQEFPKDQVFSYFKKFKDGKLSNKVASPALVANNFLKIIGKTKEDLIIFVGHGAALESFCLFQSVFVPSRTIEKELAYAEFIVLKEAI